MHGSGFLSFVHFDRLLSSASKFGTGAFAPIARQQTASTIRGLDLLSASMVAMVDAAQWLECRAVGLQGGRESFCLAVLAQA